tara:strand:+ start:228 stop:632 length:405 start_codon:yes stop_codon:yes gene_type:complete
MSKTLKATLALGSSFGSMVAGEEARKDTNKARKVQERVRQMQDTRARLAQVREARMAQAQVIQSGATQGALESSAVQGGYSAIGSNAENNIQFINQVDTLQQAINKRMESSQNNAAYAQGLAQISNTVASAGGL